MNSTNATITGPLRITIVFDNNPAVQGLEMSLGFACFIEGLEKTILFDTGSEGRMLLANMEKLGFAPEDIGIVVLSHDHWDHIGGLEAVLRRKSNLKIFLPADFPFEFKKSIASAGASVVEVSRQRQLCQGAWTTGVLGDGIREQSFICDSPQGAVLITGCAHPGIVRIVEVAKTIHPNVHLVMGGFHLGGASDDELHKIAARFREMKVQKVGPTHCSGDSARAVFKEIYRTDAILPGVGSVIHIPTEGSL